eukprot:6471117-Amphidinium_carterae.2
MARPGVLAVLKGLQTLEQCYVAQCNIGSSTMSSGSRTLSKAQVAITTMQKCESWYNASRLCIVDNSTSEFDMTAKRETEENNEIEEIETENNKNIDVIENEKEDNKDKMCNRENEDNDEYDNSEEEMQTLKCST